MHAIRTILAIAAIAPVAALEGCVERRIWIDTDPPGALVWLNDAQLGRSPVDVGILHDGVYDLRIEKEGFEPIVTGVDVHGPIWDAVPLDFFAEVLPVDARHDSRWRFTLRQRDDSESALVERAARLRDSMPAPATQPSAR